MALRADDLASNLTTMLARHRCARSALFESGGNDVSRARLPGSATPAEIDAILADLDTISDAIIVAGHASAPRTWGCHGRRDMPARRLPTARMSTGLGPV
jgi:hypothetical protein